MIMLKHKNICFETRSGPQLASVYPTRKTPGQNSPSAKTLRGKDVQSPEDMSYTLPCPHLFLWICQG